MDKDAVVDAQLCLNYFLNRILKRCNIFIFNGIEKLLSILAQYTFILIFNSLHAYRAVNGINNSWTHNYFMHWLKASYLQFPCVKYYIAIHNVSGKYNTHDIKNRASHMKILVDETFMEHMFDLI